MLRNTAGQKWRVLAFNTTNNQVVTGDAANITAKIAIDYGTRTALADTHPEEAEDGFYYFDLSQAETDGHLLEIFPESSTSNVQVIGVPGLFNTETVPETGTDLSDDLIAFNDEYGPKKVQTPNMTVEQFSPLEIQRARDRESAAYPTLGSMHITIASPDHCKYYPTRRTR
jgi:hypothetical protein